MGSGGSYDDYSDRVGRGYGSRGSSGRSVWTDDTFAGSAERRRAEDARRKRLAESRRHIREEAPPPRSPRREDPSAQQTRHDARFDPSKVRNKITKPPSHADRVHVVLVDNSGSNRTIAQHIRKASGYLLAILGELIDDRSAVAIVYFSDHCDGDRLRQDVDFVLPGEDGDKILYSTTYKVANANGGDEPEAIECMLWEVCDIDFAHVPKERRHLYLVTDVVAHGMGLRNDDGCPRGRNWRDSVRRVGEMFATFQIVGCGGDWMVPLQQQFLAEDRRNNDLISLHKVPSAYRNPLSVNAVLFLMARNLGVQIAQVFLMALYEKWLSEPIFGQETDLKAQEAIERFISYLELPEEEEMELKRRIFAG